MNKLETAKDIMQYINKDFIEKHNMFLIGGTTISLLNEDYRTSDDLDFYYEDKNQINLEDFNDFLLKNEIYEIESLKNDFYNIKIIIVKKEDPNFTPYKIEMVKFEEPTIKLINETLKLQEYNGFKALSNDNLLFLKLASFFNRHDNFPYKDFFDLFILHNNLGKNFKNLNNINHYLKLVTNNKIENFGNALLNLTAKMIISPDLLNNSKNKLKINKDFDKEDVMELLVQYIKFEQEFHPTINRIDFIEKLDILLTENKIDILANQKRRLNLKPNLEELLEEEINEHKLYQNNHRNRKKI